MHGGDERGEIKRSRDGKSLGMNVDPFEGLSARGEEKKRVEAFLQHMKS